MKKWSKWVNRTFGRRIMVFFIPAIVALILIIAGINSYIYYSSFFKESQQNIKGIVKQGSYTMDLYFQDVKTTVALLANDDDLIYMLTNYDSMDVRERFYQQAEVDEKLRNTSLMREHILDCIIVGVNGYQTSMPDRAELKYERNLLEEEWMQPYIHETGGGFYYTGAHLADYYYGSETEHWVISVVFPVVRYGERLGYIIVDLDFQKMNKIVNAGNEIDSLRYLVVDSNGGIVFSDEEDEINTTLSDEIAAKLEQEDAFFFPFRGTEMFCVHEKSSTTHWEFLCLVEKDTIIQPVVQMQRILGFVVLPVFLVITCLLSVRLARKVKRPLEEIVAQMDQIDIDHPKPFTVRNSVGEIEYLADKITEMSVKITNLINQVYKAEIKSKDAQIEALISQINPHFLYNTLQLIKTESIKGNGAEVSDTVNCLSRFLRYTINNRELYVTLSEELDYIRSYVEIYKKRFPGKYTLLIETEEGTENIMIPKLTLQPVVENAIKHGMSKKSGPGIISIRVKHESEFLVVIEDNGVGMEAAAMDALLARIHSADSSGVHVGLHNVQERLELGGGEGYGIFKLESEPGNYFRVFIRIKGGHCDV